MVHREPIVRASLTVVVTLWLVLSWANIPSLFAYSSSILYTLIATLAGIAVGSLIVFLDIYSVRASNRSKLAGQHLRGLRSNMGAIPLHVHPHQRSTTTNLRAICAAVPEIVKLAATDGSEPHTWLVSRIEKAKQTDPPIASLTEAVLSTLVDADNRLQFPAGPRRGDHGGRSLLQHSLLVAYLMTRLSKDFDYQPDKGVSLADPMFSWRNHADDPLVLVTGLTHDIGKLLCFRPQPESPDLRVVGEHSRAGLRLLALMPEYWALTLKQRETLSSVMYAYHEPELMPMARGSDKPLSDLRMALMQLLIKSDTMSGALEARASHYQAPKHSALADTNTPTESPAEASEIESMVDTASDPAEAMKARKLALTEAGRRGESPLLDLAVALLTDAERINSLDDTKSVAFKYDHPLYKKSLLVIHEMGLRIALLRERGGTIQAKDMPKQRGKVAEITGDLQRLLAGAGLLWDGYTEDKRTPGNQLVNVRWVSEHNYWEDRDEAVVKANFSWAPEATKNWKMEWAAAYVIDITDHPAFENIRGVASYDCVPVFGNNILGSRGRIATVAGKSPSASPPRPASATNPLPVTATETQPTHEQPKFEIAEGLRAFAAASPQSARFASSGALEAVNLVDAIKHDILSEEQQRYAKGLPRQSTPNSLWVLIEQNSEGQEIWLYFDVATASPTTLSASAVAT